jgi:hypothetical protein
LNNKIIKKCEKCGQENETVYANYLLYGFMICESCKLSDTLKWNGLAKKSGFETDDILTEIKIENKERPDKDIVYPFALLILGLFGYLNYRKQSIR